MSAEPFAKDWDSTEDTIYNDSSGTTADGLAGQPGERSIT